MIPAGTLETTGQAMRLISKFRRCVDSLLDADVLAREFLNFPLDGVLHEVLGVALCLDILIHGCVEGRWFELWLELLLLLKILP